MTAPVSRATVEAFYQAYASNDPERIGATLDDDVEWQVAGPVEVMQICGSWHGRTAVIDRYARLVPRILASKRLEIEHLLIDGDSSAMFGRITSRHRDSGRMISHRLAHIVRYRNGKVGYFRAINDSFDAAEQFLGHRIDVSHGPAPALGDLVVV